MSEPRLEVNDGLGRRVIPIDKPTLTIGRRTESDVRLVGSDVSRDHAEIAAADGSYILRDKGSRYGTFVNGEQVSGGTGCEPSEGFLCLESEGSPIEFRNLRIRELPAP